MNEKNDWEELIDRHLRGELNELEKEQLAELLDSDSEARREFVLHAQWDTRIAEALREDHDSPREPAVLLADRSTTIQQRPPKTTLLRLLLAVSAIVIVTLSTGLLYQKSSADRRVAEMSRNIQRPLAEPPIARITGLSGTLIWTGDRGQIVRDVTVGTELAGGTIEGVAPNSWFELEFNDGSTVMISGTSMLTFADLGQKELRLKEGVFSASVVPQPEGKPMLIHTRSALLEVLGTQFEVEAGLTSTALNVTEGKVRLMRLSDGKEVDVPAKHRVITEGDGELTLQRVPDSVDHWKSQLELGPHDVYGNYGKWVPAGDSRPALIRAIPFVPPHDRKQLLHLLGISLVRSDNSPVVVKPGSFFVVRGRLATAADVVLGMRVTRANGEFAGMFLARQPAGKFTPGSDFEASFPLNSFSLDPCVWDRKDELPAKPDGLILTGVWLFTYTGKPTGLEVTEVELIPSERQTPEASGK